MGGAKGGVVGAEGVVLEVVGKALEWGGRARGSFAAGTE